MVGICESGCLDRLVLGCRGCCRRHRLGVWHRRRPSFFNSLMRGGLALSDGLTTCQIDNTGSGLNCSGARNR